MWLFLAQGKLPFKGLKHVTFGFLSQPFVEAKDSDWLALLEEYNGNPASTYHFIADSNRRYASGPKVLEPFLEQIREKATFLDSEIVHESSLLGLPYMIRLRTSETVQVESDGVLIVVTRELEPGAFSETDLLDKMHLHRGPTWTDVTTFADQLKVPLTYCHEIFVVGETTFEDLSMELDPRKNYFIQCWDPYIFEWISGTGESRAGKAVRVGIGNYRTILEILAHDFDIVKHTSQYAEQLGRFKAMLSRTKGDLRFEYQAITSGLLALRKREKAWKLAKMNMNSLATIESQLSLLSILFDILQSIGDPERLVAFRNIPITLWVLGHEPDPEERTTWPTSYPLSVGWKDGRLVKIDEKFNYHRPFISIRSTRDLEELTKINEKLWVQQRDVLTMFEVEFGQYAVLIAIAALAISILAVVIQGFL